MHNSTSYPWKEVKSWKFSRVDNSLFSFRRVQVAVVLTKTKACSGKDDDLSGSGGISDPISFGSWCIKGTDASTLVTALLVPLINHDPSDLGSLILIQKTSKESTQSLHKFVNCSCYLSKKTKHLERDFCPEPSVS